MKPPVPSLSDATCSPTATLPTLVASISVNTETNCAPHPGPPENPFNSIDLFPAGFDNIGSTSVPTDITLAPYEYDAANPDPAFDRDNPILDDSLPAIFLQLVDTYPSNTTPDLNALRAQIDTGAGVSCTNLLFALWNYRAYTAAWPAPIKLTAALARSTVPLGEGYLRLPGPGNTYVDVLTYYSPDLTSTLVSEKSILYSTNFPVKEYGGQWIRKFFTSDDCETGNITVLCQHKICPSKNIVVHGVLLLGQCYSHPLILPDPDTNLVAPSGPKALNPLQSAKLSDPLFADSCKASVKTNIASHKQNLHALLTDNLKALPRAWVNSIDFHSIVDQHLTPHSVPVQAIKAKTEKLLWHQRLGHPCDQYLYDAHKHIDGVPKFSKITTVLDQCPTCIQSKQTKTAPGRNTTQVATQPYQGLSIDFSFSGMSSKNTDRRADFEGINGETAWILITDHFTGMKHGDTRISKAAPVNWLRHFLAQYNPLCKNKYVYMDQGGELFNHPDVQNLFTSSGYQIFPTGADASHQNAPVERAHRTLANSIRALLTGSALHIKFWPYAFYHALRLTNAFPTAGNTASPVFKATASKEDLHALRTFGCRVWVRPPGKRKAKLVPNSRKGIFLGYVPYTTRNILWYDPATTRVKIATHARFDEGMNDLPVTEIPPNVQHLSRTDDGVAFPAEQSEVAASDFSFYISPFSDLLHKRLSHTAKSSHSTYGFSFADDPLMQKPYVEDIADKSDACRLFSNRRASRNRLRGAFLVSIDGDRIFTSAAAIAKLQSIYDQGVCREIPMVFAPERRMNKAAARKAANEYGLFAPTTKWDEPEPVTTDDTDLPFLDRTATINAVQSTKHQCERDIKYIYNTASLHAKIQRNLAPTEDDMDVTVPSMDIHSLRAIASLRNPDLSFAEADLSTEMIELVINAIQSKATTTAEQALGHFTRRKLKSLTTWNEWEAGERKQLKQFHELQMFGNPITPPSDPDTIILRPHWQYHIKRDGTRRARLCCNGSKIAAPLLHALATTYSSCVEHPIQRLFFAIAAQLNKKVFGGDAKDAYGHSPGPEVPTYITIDEQYYDWYKYEFGEALDRRKVLPVKRALQGHPESGKLWEQHINKILTASPLNFKSTTHDKTIYKADFNGETVYLLRQVDDFAIACDEEATAESIYDIIGKQLRLQSETSDPFTYLGLITDFNGIDVKQTREYIEISCAGYIDRIITSHGWTNEKNMLPVSKPISPLPTDTLHQIAKHTNGPKEGTAEHSALEAKAGFSYRTLLGEMMYAYVSCRPDIGYPITLMSKYASNPEAYHYSCLKNIAKYLRTTKHWGIRYKRAVPRDDLPSCNDPEIFERDPKLPEYPEDIAQNKLIGFVDAAYGNDPKKRRSTTGYAFTYSGGAIVYRSKAQSIVALSSTEAELIAAVTAAKTVRYLRSILSELGFEQTEPTPIYEDNRSAIDIVNSNKPTERSRHIDIRFFAIQDWKARGDIVLKHIPGVINAADDLTKPLGWVLHSRHARYMMGHFNYIK